MQQEEEFFDLDKARYGLVPVHCEVWEGFIFVNFANEPEQSLPEFLGPMITNLAGYPFEKLTSRWHYRSEVKANWKLYMDAFQEFYHAPILHANQSPTSFSKAAAEAGFEAPHYQIEGPHRLVSTSGIRAWEMDASMRKPIEDICQSGLFGPWDGPDLGEMPVGLNPAKCSPWGLDSFQLFPNFVILFWGQGWYLTYHYWPTSYNTHIFEGTIYFPPARTPRERVAQELAAVSFKEYGLQDANTLEATQTMVESRAVDKFLLLRPGGPAAAPAQGDRLLDRRVSAQYGGSVTVTAMLPTEFADLEMFSEWCLPTEPQRYAKRLASSMVEMQAFYDAITDRAEEALSYCDKFPLDDLPDDVLNLMHLLYSMIMVSFPVECWKQPRVPDSGASTLDCDLEPVP